MKRYVAFLRGVSPMNAKMSELKKAFEAAGFEDVKTVLGSGNVVFGARAAPLPGLQRKAETAMEKTLGRSFSTLVRSVDTLRDLIESDPYRRFELPPGAKRVVTFLREPPAKKPKLPVWLNDARILSLEGTEAFSVYVSGPDGPLFMTLIEKTFGKDVTTRTWDTVRKCAK